MISNSDKKIHEDYFGRTNTGQEIRYKWYLNKYFSGVRNKKILEVGCGDGGIVQFLKSHNDTYAVDISKSGVKFLNRRGIKAFLRDVSEESLPFADKTFDYVIILEVLEHLKSPQRAIEEIQRVLKKGGVMIASTPNPRTTHKLLYPSLFTYHGFKDYLKNNRFTIIESTTYGICPPFWKFLKGYLERKHLAERKVAISNGVDKPAILSRIARMLSGELFAHFKPKVLGWSFVYVCKNDNPSGAKDLYDEIAFDTKKAYH